MNDAVDGGVLGENLVEGFLVGDIELVEFGSATADLLDTIDRDLRRVVQTVDDDNVVAILEKRKGGEGANVASATLSNNKDQEKTD